MSQAGSRMYDGIFCFSKTSLCYRRLLKCDLLNWEYFCFIDNAQNFHCVDHNKLWKILQEMGIPVHLTCLLRSLYAGQEATVRTRHGTTDWFKIRKGVHQDCILSPCLCNRAHHEKYQAGWLTSRNQDFWEKYQQPQICRWYHFNGRKSRGTEEPLDEG